MVAGGKMASTSTLVRPISAESGITKKTPPLHTRNGLSAFRRRVPGFYIQLRCFPGKSPAFPLLHFATASVSLERGDAALLQMH